MPYLSRMVLKFISRMLPSVQPTDASKWWLCYGGMLWSNLEDLLRQLLMTRSKEKDDMHLPRLTLQKQVLRIGVSSQGRMQKREMSPVASTAMRIGCMGENPTEITLLLTSMVPYRMSLPKSHKLIIPSSAPVTSVQYLEEAAAHVNSKWVSLISLINWNYDYESLQQISSLPSNEHTINRECSLRNNSFTIDLFQYYVVADGDGAISCRNYPVYEQYSLTNPPASPTKNFLLLYPNQHAVILVQQFPQVSLVNTCQRLPVIQLQILTSLEVNRKILFVDEHILKSNIEWNQLISFDFFSRDGALNWVIFFQQTRHYDSYGIIYSLDGLMKFFSQLMIWMVWNLLKSHILMLSLSSKDSTYGKDLRNLAVRRLPVCSLYLPVNPFTREMSRLQMQIEEEKPQLSTQLPNSRVQSTPSTPFLYLELMAEFVWSGVCQSQMDFFRQLEQYLMVPSMEDVIMQSGYSDQVISVMRDQCCFRVKRDVQSMAVLDLYDTVDSLSYPDLDRNAHILCNGRYSTLWQFFNLLISTQLYALTLPTSFILQYFALPQNNAQNICIYLSRAKSVMKLFQLYPFNQRKSTMLNLESNILTQLLPLSNTQYLQTTPMQFIFLMQLAVPGSITLVILYSFDILEYAEEMIQFYWNILFLQLGLSTLLMFYMMYQVNQDHSK